MEVPVLYSQIPGRRAMASNAAASFLFDALPAGQHDNSFLNA